MTKDEYKKLKLVLKKADYSMRRINVAEKKVAYYTRLDFYAEEGTDRKKFAKNKLSAWMKHLKDAKKYLNDL